MRSHLSKPIVDLAGNLQDDAVVTVRVMGPGSTVLVEDVLYQGPTGSLFYSNPMHITNGLLDFYMIQEARVRLGVTVADEDEQIHEDVDVLRPGIIDDIPTGLWLQSPDGTLWEITIDDRGVLHSNDGIPEP